MNTLALVILFFLSVSALPKVPKDAELCSGTKCKIEESCRCSTSYNPIPGEENPAPQLVAISFNDGISQFNYDTYFKPLFFGKKNPDGSPVGLTFFVSHEFTDYALVHDLYTRGYEIADFSITKNPNLSYWESASQKDLEDEFGGQKTIISTFANIPLEDITGVRTPYLRLNGDVSINAYQSSGLKYDSSWATDDNLLPYSLDYKSLQSCRFITNCPLESHPKFWITPLITVTEMSNNPDTCNYFSDCLKLGTPVQISNWLYGQIRRSNRAPMVLLLDLKWFQTVENSYKGFELFLDGLKTVEDVFLVSVQDVVDWVNKPVTAEEYKVPDHGDRTSDCINLICPLQNDQGLTKYMKSCIPCPEKYPWKGNPLGKK